LDLFILLILAISALSASIGFFVGKKLAISDYTKRFRLWEYTIRKEAISRSRAVLSGKVSEQLAPYLPGFKYDPTDVRFLGTPIDLIVFNGAGRGDPKEIVFIEIKYGKSNLSSKERKIKELIEKQKIRWELLRISF